MLAKLEGHKQAIRGIFLPLGFDKLYSGSSDGTARIWDCNTGQCAHSTDLGGEVGSLITEGHWVFIGMKNVVKALNIQTTMEFSLNGPVGQVYAMVVAGDMIFAGAQNGAIIAWKASVEANAFLEAGSLEGHTGAILCLIVGDKMLFSGSVDQTIRVWDTDSLNCIKTLNGHDDAVMSLVHWNHHLFSCSVDCSIKVWLETEGQNSWENIHTHNEKNGVLTLCGMNDAENKPVLFCSCNDDTVRLYDLPLFSERGKLFSQQVRVIERGPDGLFFTGDTTGSLTVWKWQQKPQGGDS